MAIKDIRTEFENQPKEFYGGNNLQRDGEGYDSSYVNMKWEMFKDIKTCSNQSVQQLIVWLQHIQISSIESKENALHLGENETADMFRAEEDLIDLFIDELRERLL